MSSNEQKNDVAQRLISHQHRMVDKMFKYIREIDANKTDANRSIDERLTSARELQARSLDRIARCLERYLAMQARNVRSQSAQNRRQERRRRPRRTNSIRIP